MRKELLKCSNYLIDKYRRMPEYLGYSNKFSGFILCTESTWLIFCLCNPLMLQPKPYAYGKNKV